MSNILASSIIGIATGICAAWISHWQVRAQRLWEKKEEAYLEILDALHVMSRTNTEFLEAYYNQRNIPDERDTALRAAWNEAKIVVLRHAELGSFLTSLATETVLIKLKKTLEKDHEDYFLSLDAESASLKNAVAAVKQAAIADRRYAPLVWFRRSKWTGKG